MLDEKYTVGEKKRVDGGVGMLVMLLCPTTA